jgi:molecular chaperone GrpE
MTNEIDDEIPYSAELELMEGGAEAASPDVHRLEAEIAQLKAENAQLKDQSLRFAAEAENVRRRSEREMNDARAFAIQRFAKDLLGVSDNLSRALKSLPAEAQDPALRSLSQGVEMTEKELLAAFERNGLKRVEPNAGDRFDPNQHQAMMEQPSGDVPPGSVIQTLQPGWELFGRIVRPAMVITASRASAANEAQTAYAQAGGPSGESFDTKA